MMPLRRGRTICACAIFLTPILSAQTAPPTLSAGSVLLLAGKDDPASVATLTAALQGPDASVRAAAARVIGTGRYPSLLNALAGALAREQDGDAADELLRAVLFYGGETVLPLADGQARRLGPRAELMVAEWLGRVAPQKLLDRLPDLLSRAAAAGLRGRLKGIVAMSAGQHPEAAESLRQTWQALLAREPVSSPAELKWLAEWMPARPVSAGLANLINASLTSSLFQAARCEPKRDRGGVGGVVFRLDGRPARIEVNPEQLPQGCVAALNAIVRTTVPAYDEPIADGTMKYLVTPFTEAFATCTAAARKGRGEEVSRVGGQIAPPRKTKDVRPLYPPAAQEARVQGTVIIEATISPRGCVSAAHVIKSVPLLDVAALWAVAQWEYTPTLLNGTPVAVIMTVTSTFTLK